MSLRISAKQTLHTPVRGRIAPTPGTAAVRLVLAACLCLLGAAALWLLPRGPLDRLERALAPGSPPAAASSPGDSK